jgi:hypothetical protein
MLRSRAGATCCALVGLSAASTSGAASIVPIGASDFSLEHRSLADSLTPEPDWTGFSMPRPPSTG